MKIFSFSYKKQIYTIWDVYYTYEAIDENRQYKIANYKYLGSTAEPSENIDVIAYNRLRSFKKKSIEFTNNDTFRFGKYKGKKINEINDLKYTKWYFEIVEDPNHKEFVKNFLYDNWYEFKTNYEGKEYAVSPQTLKKYDEIDERQKYMLEKAKLGKVVMLEINSNPKEDGKIIIDGITYYFPKVAPRYFNGIRYFVPICNGKAKRIKNKVIEAKLFNLDNDIFISNFNVIK